MTAPIIFKFAIGVMLILILLSLGAGVFFLVKDEGKSNNLVNSLTIRVVLSIGLFALLFLGYKFGWIQPHGMER